MTTYDVKDGTLSPFLKLYSDDDPSVISDSGTYRLAIAGNATQYDAFLYDTASGSWRFKLKLGGTAPTVGINFLCSEDWSSSMYLNLTTDAWEGIQLRDVNNENIIWDQSDLLELNTLYDIEVTKEGDLFSLYVDDVLIDSAEYSYSFNPEIIVVSGFNSGNGYALILDEIETVDGTSPDQTILATSLQATYSNDSPIILAGSDEGAMTINLDSPNTVQSWEFSEDLDGWSKKTGAQYITIEDGKVKFSGSAYGAWSAIQILFEENIGIWEYDFTMSDHWASALEFLPVKENESNDYGSIYAWIPSAASEDYIDLSYKYYDLQGSHTTHLLDDDYVSDVLGIHTVKIVKTETSIGLYLDDVQFGVDYQNPPEVDSNYMTVVAKAAEEAPIYLDEIRYTTAFNIPEVIFTAQEPLISTTSHLPLESNYQLPSPNITVQASTTINALTPTSTYTSMDAIIREGAGVNAAISESNYYGTIPSIYYDYTIVLRYLYSQYSIIPWEENKIDIETIFPRIILKEIKEIIVPPIRQ